ncbi:unnamed protein product, partial [Notodromas monacha]
TIHALKKIGSFRVFKSLRNFASADSIFAFVSPQIIAFDELKTDYKNPIDQCNSLNPLVLPEYLMHMAFNLLLLISGEWVTVLINAPLIAYHVLR